MLKKTQTDVRDKTFEYMTKQWSNSGQDVLFNRYRIAMFRTDILLSYNQLYS